MSDSAEILHGSYWKESTILVLRRARWKKSLWDRPTNQKWYLKRFFENSGNFKFFLVKHPHTKAFKRNLGRNHFYFDFIATICLILCCFVYRISPIKPNLHE